MSGSLAHRVALVTGGGGGIGGAIVERLRAAGCRVASADVAEPAQARDEILDITMDITDEGSVEAGIEGVIAETGRIDILVNNAGLQRHQLFLDTTAETRSSLIEVNLVGALNVARHVLPHMVEAGSGRVINIASDAARIGSVFEAPYAAAKGGLISFTRTLAREMGRHQITCNCVCPGPTDTPMLARYAENNPRALESMARHVPLGRIAQPEDITPLIEFLAGDGAAYITGQTISVSGGLTMV